MVLYRTEDGRTALDVRFDAQTLWLSLAQLVELFQTTKQNINLHVQNIHREGELSKEATVKEYLTVQKEGNRQVRRRIEHFNLPMILAIGYRVRSRRGTQFRQWATEKLEEYLRKGFVLDDGRLKNPPGPGVPDYFDEMLERIRDIRASERRMYLRVREILGLAADYDPKDEETLVFFQTVQNKLHFAVTGMTAPEIIAGRADSSRPNMGLTSWRGSVVRRGDIHVAKNYLHEDEITELNRIVTMFLDYAEDQARRRKQIFMRNWREKLDEFLRFNERRVLGDAGRVSRKEAQRRTIEEYAKFESLRREDAERRGEVEMLGHLEARIKSLSRKKKR
ncbi:MAG: virulence RhuM family protein [Deltaproteobacteria bacterium]|nr:virulence RhuM family protein [Deltaproteobacteria bacterium]